MDFGPLSATSDGLAVPSGTAATVDRTKSGDPTVPLMMGHNEYVVYSPAQVSSPKPQSEWKQT